MRKALVVLGVLLGVVALANPGPTIGFLCRPDLFADGYTSPWEGYGQEGFLWLSLGYDSGGPGVDFPWFAALDIQYPFILAGGYQVDAGVAVPVTAQALRISLGLSVGGWWEDFRLWNGFWAPFVGLDYQLNEAATGFIRANFPMVVSESDEFLGVWLSFGLNFKPWDWVAAPAGM